MIQTNVSHNTTAEWDEPSTVQTSQDYILLVLLQLFCFTIHLITSDPSIVTTFLHKYRCASQSLAPFVHHSTIWPTCHSRNCTTSLINSHQQFSRMKRPLIHYNILRSSSAFFRGRRTLVCNILHRLFPRGKDSLICSCLHMISLSWHFDDGGVHGVIAVFLGVVLRDYCSRGGSIYFFAVAVRVAGKGTVRGE